MAKDSPGTKPVAETPFRRFQQLARKLIAVPKGATEKPKDKRRLA